LSKKAIGLLALTLALCIFRPVAAQSANISFDNVAAAFRDAGYVVVGPVVLSTHTALTAMRFVFDSGGMEMFALYLYNNSAAANEGWVVAGDAVEVSRATNEAMVLMWQESGLDVNLLPNMITTRGRAGLFVWLGTPGAMALFESARN